MAKLLDGVCHVLVAGNHELELFKALDMEPA